jgi:hypothetical protein
MSDFITRIWPEKSKVIRSHNDWFYEIIEDGKTIAKGRGFVSRESCRDAVAVRLKGLKYFRENKHHIPTVHNIPRYNPMRDGGGEKFGLQRKPDASQREEINRRIINSRRSNKLANRQKELDENIRHNLQHEAPHLGAEH